MSATPLLRGGEDLEDSSANNNWGKYIYFQRKKIIPTSPLQRGSEYTQWGFKERRSATSVRSKR